MQSSCFDDDATSQDSVVAAEAGASASPLGITAFDDVVVTVTSADAGSG